MDPLTHALSGAVAARATAPKPNHDLPGPAARTAAGTTAALFPDIDVALRLVDPLFYLTYHRGITHSLIMAPVWALLLAILFSAVSRGRYTWSTFYGVSLLGLLIHIFGDLINEYGTQIFAPLSTQAFSLSTTFVVDPYLTGLLLAGLALSYVWRLNVGAALGLLACTVLIALQATQFQHARALGADLAQQLASRAGAPAAAVHVLPQPFSPFNWMVVLEERDRYRLTRVNLARRDALESGDDYWIGRRMVAAYRPAHDLRWQTFQRYDPRDPGRAREVWHHPELADFRRFAGLPAHYGTTYGPVCVWFQDLRFRAPEIRPPFIYGACGGPEAWRLHRLDAVTGKPRPSGRPRG